MEQAYCERLLPQGLLGVQSPKRDVAPGGQLRGEESADSELPEADEEDRTTVPGEVNNPETSGSSGTRPGSRGVKRATTPAALQGQEREAARGMGVVRLQVCANPQPSLQPHVIFFSFSCQMRLFGMLDALVTTRDERVVAAVAGRSKLPSVLLRVARMFRKVLLQSSGLETLCAELHQQEETLTSPPLMSLSGRALTLSLSLTCCHGACPPKVLLYHMLNTLCADKAKLKRGVLKARDEKRKRAAGNAGGVTGEEDVTPYMAFATSIRPMMREEFPELTVQALTQKIGQRWSMLPEDAKQRYAAEAEESNVEARQAAIEAAKGDPDNPAMTPLTTESDEEDGFDDEQEESSTAAKLREGHRGWFRDPVRVNALLCLLTSAGAEMTDPDGLVSLGELVESLVRDTHPSTQSVVETWSSE